MTSARAQYDEQRKEVDCLLSLHSELHKCRTKSDTSVRGRRSADLEVLHKSAVVLLTACWEAFIENILREAIGIIARDLQDTQELHEGLRKSIARATSAKLSITSKNDLFPWYFVGEGWRSLLLEYAELRVSELNTPDSSAVRSIVSMLLGIEDVTTSWGRQRKSSIDAAHRLDEYLSDRHSIAHGAPPTKKFNKSYVEAYIAFLDITVKKTQQQINKRLTTLGVSLP